MRVGLPSEASSCRWSARGPRDRPERRRSGLAHVVRARFSLHHFCVFFRNGTLQVFVEGGVPIRVLTLLRFPCLPFIFISNWKRARSARNFPQISLDVLSQEYGWPPENISQRPGGEAALAWRIKSCSGPPRVPGIRARGRARAGSLRLQPRQVSVRKAACSAALPPRRGAVALARLGPHEAGAVPAPGRERVRPGLEVTLVFHPRP